jgi:MFS family permease
VIDAPVPVGIPPRYWLWLAAMGLSLLGTQVLAFGMTWAAASLSGALAGLVLTAVTLPRVLLLLVGGAVADRAGPFRVLLIGDGVMLAVTLALALALGWAGLSPALLIGAALAIGAVDAFYLPASGTMPRHLAPAPSLARAMAARQLTGQVAAFGGAPLGGLLVALAGLAAAAYVDGATFALMFVVLMLIRPRGSAGDGQQPGPSLWRRSLDGLRVVAVDRTLRLSMLLVCAAAGLLLPVPALLVPLLGRERGWSAGTAGLVVGAVALGTATVAVAVLVVRASSRPGVAGPAGLLLAAVGVGGLALPVPSPSAVALGLVIGLGTGVFTAHIGPLILGQTPASHMSRVQAVLVLTQSLPLLATITLLGTAADVVGTPAVLVGCGIALAVAATAALAAPALMARTMGGESGHRPA